VYRSAAQSRTALPSLSRLVLSSHRASPFLPLCSVHPVRGINQSSTPSPRLAAARPVTNPKLTTFITGIDVIPNAREVLLSLYEETIKKAEAYGSNDFNDHCIQLCRYRHGLVSRETDVAAIEALVNCGQIEELVAQAEDQYDLLIAMNETIRPWEPDPDGDAAFADYHPSFGQTAADFSYTNLKDDAKIFQSIDAELGLAAPPPTDAEAGRAAPGGAQPAVAAQQPAAAAPPNKP